MHLTVLCLTVHVGYKREKRHHNYYTESVIPFAILFSEYIPQGESEMDQGGVCWSPGGLWAEGLMSGVSHVLKVILVFPVLYLR